VNKFFDTEGRVNVLLDIELLPSKIGGKRAGTERYFG
jgi:hypothetical protein